MQLKVVLLEYGESQEMELSKLKKIMVHRDIILICTSDEEYFNTIKKWNRSEKKK